MELSKFIQLLKKRKYILIGVPLLAICVAYFLVRKMPDYYTSKTIVATGLVDQSEQLIIDNKSESQESKINQEFNNIIQIMQLKKVVEQVSYRLMMHDLSVTPPYIQPGKLFFQLNNDAKAHALATFSELALKGKSLQMDNNDHRGLQKLLESMGYDDQSLNKKLLIYRVNSSDYIDIEFQSPSPELSAIVANSVFDETLKYYSEIVKKSHSEAINFLDSVLKQKKEMMDSKVQLLKNYKIDNRVLNLNEQAKSFYGLLADFETKKELTKKDIQAYSGAIQNIDAKFDPKERKYFESKLTSINQDIVNTKEILNQLNNDYIKSNFDAKYKAKVDSVKQLLVFQINQSNDKYIENPLAIRQNLILEKVKLEVELDISKNSYKVLSDELTRLNERFDKLVPHEAVIQSYEQAIEFASNEYLEILKKYNQTALESTFSIHLKQIEKALPGPKLASKKILLMIVAGVMSFLLCMVAFFILFYIDDSIKYPIDLANATKIATLGSLPFLNSNLLQLQQLWIDKSPESINYKNLLRDIRFEIDSEMNGLNVLLISSIKNREGKTIFALSLAYAYSIIHKKVLVIDGNFSNPELTRIAAPSYYFEDYINNKTSIDKIRNDEMINVLGNYSGDSSLLEINNQTVIATKMKELKTLFDIIIIELPALENLNKSKEWMYFGDKLVAVFQSNQSISSINQQYIYYLQSLKAKFAGWILTKTKD